MGRAARSPTAPLDGGRELLLPWCFPRSTSWEILWCRSGVPRHVLWDFAPYINILGNKNIGQARFPAIYKNAVGKEQLELKVSFLSGCNFITTNY